MVLGGSGSGENNVLLNLIKHQRLDIDKIYLYLKDPLESKYEVLINGREKVGTENLILQTIGDFYNNRELQLITSNHSSDIDFKDFVKLYKDYTKDHIHF